MCVLQLRTGPRHRSVDNALFRCWLTCWSTSVSMYDARPKFWLSEPTTRVRNFWTFRRKIPRATRSCVCWLVVRETCEFGLCYDAKLRTLFPMQLFWRPRRQACSTVDAPCVVFTQLSWVCFMLHASCVACLCQEKGLAPHWIRHVFLILVNASWISRP